MKATRFLALLMIAGLPAALIAAEAEAQTAACRSIQAELASLDRAGSNPRAAAQANRARAQVQRIAGYMASIGCDRARIPIFGSSPPPECFSLRGQLQQAQANLAAAEAASGGNPSYAAQRRRDLQAALQNYGCAGAAPQEARQPRGLLESLFGAPRPAAPPAYGGYGSMEMRPDGDMPDGDAPEPSDDAGQERRASGGGKAVCVRSCDGYFFPLDIAAGRAREDGDALCQALCPGAPTSVYFMTLGGDIENAVSAAGQNYTALPSALRYRQAVQPDCVCKRDGESWASLLKPAEGLLGNEHSSDVTVTPQQSLEMARPGAPNTVPAAPGAAPAKNKTNAAAQNRRPPPSRPLVTGDPGQNFVDPDDDDDMLAHGVRPILRGGN